MKTFRYPLAATLSAITLTLMLSGCGGEAYRTSTPNTSSGGTTGGNNTPYGGTTPSDNWGGSGGSGGTGSNGSGGSSNTTPTTPAYSYDFSMTGEGGTNPVYTSASVDTDNLLRVRVSARSAGVLSIPGQYSGFSANYGCVVYEVTALGKTLSTGVLSTGVNNVNCPGAPLAADLDFSDRLGSGHNTVNIQIKKVYYDFYCQWARWVNSTPYNIYAYGYQNEAYFCPVRPVFKNHVVNGKVQIQVNGTAFSSL